MQPGQGRFVYGNAGGRFPVSRGLCLDVPCALNPTVEFFQGNRDLGSFPFAFGGDPVRLGVFKSRARHSQAILGPITRFRCETELLIQILHFPGDRFSFRFNILQLFHFVLTGLPSGSSKFKRCLGPFEPCFRGLNLSIHGFEFFCRILCLLHLGLCLSKPVLAFVTRKDILQFFERIDLIVILRHLAFEVFD